MRAKDIATIATSALLLTAAAACEQSKPVPAGEQPAGPGAAVKTTKPAGGTSVPAGGTKHDPPIKPEQVTDGHWYCDMGGTVHYSRADKGDGKCPICEMALKQKGAAGDSRAH